MAAMVVALGASRVLGQSYGIQDQVLTIGMAEAPRTGDNYFGSDGYLYDAGFEGPGPAFVVPLNLPVGAEVRGLCAYATDLDADTPTTLSLIAVKLVPGGGGDPYVLTIPDSVIQTTTGAGYAAYCTGSMSYTVRGAADVDGDQVTDNIATYLRVELGYHAGVGGVLVTWGRQVSPPPDAPTFGDVPASDAAFAHIEALAASGITAGCGNGGYCPDAPLTRRQMAVYLSNALGLHWVD
jgi:hypothetical protein